MDIIPWSSSPPDSGILTLVAEFSPVSAQASPSRKQRLRNQVRALVSGCSYVLTGELKIYIEWEIFERHRYESGSSADVDNVIKPLLDGLQGPDGLFVDDCQVQDVSCLWHDPFLERERFSLEIRFNPVLAMDKARLVFVQLPNGLCYPLEDFGEPEELARLCQLVIKMYAKRDALRERGLSDYAARAALPTQRAFHKNRVRGFRIVPANSILCL